MNITRNRGKSAILLIGLCLAGIAVQADAKPPRRAGKAHVRVPNVPPRPEDVGTIDGIVAAFYAVISGPAGQPRQWSRDRSLYIPGIRFVALEDSKGKPTARVVSHQEYVDWTNDGMVKQGFFESEIHRVTQVFGNIAHVFSTYETRQIAEGPVTARGINSIELYFDGSRWWITAVQWQDEGAERRIPKELLP